MRADPPRPRSRRRARRPSGSRTAAPWAPCAQTVVVGGARRAREAAGRLRGQRRVAAVVVEQVVVGAGLHDAAVVEHRDPVGVADGGEPVGDGQRGAAGGEARRTPAARPARSRCRARWWPRRAPGSAGCAAACARSRGAGARRRRSGVRAGRRRCRSPRAASAIRSWICAPRAAASISASVASGRGVAQVLAHGGVQQVGLLADDADDLGEVGQAQVRAGRRRRR